MFLAPVHRSVAAPSGIIRDGLVGRWPMDEGSGQSIADDSGNGNHGTGANLTWVAGRFGQQCPDFNGSNTSVTIPNPAGDLFNFGANDPFTIGVHYRRTGTVSSMRLWDKYPGGGGFGYYSMYTGGVVRFTMYKPLKEENTPNGSAANTWLHFCIARDSSQNLFGYIEGVEEGSWTGFNPSSLSGIADLHIGMYAPGIAHWLGQLQDMRIYDRLLSPAEIAQWASGNG